MRNVLITIDLLTPGERRDLANALLRAAWGAALEETRVLLLDLAIATDEHCCGSSRNGRTPRAGAGCDARRRRKPVMRHVIGRAFP